MPADLWLFGLFVQFAGWWLREMQSFAARADAAWLDLPGVRRV